MTPKSSWEKLSKQIVINRIAGKVCGEKLGSFCSFFCAKSNCIKHFGENGLHFALLKLLVVIIMIISIKEKRPKTGQSTCPRSRQRWIITRDYPPRPIPPTYPIQDTDLLGGIVADRSSFQSQKILPTLGYAKITLNYAKLR